MAVQGRKGLKGTGLPSVVISTSLTASFCHVVTPLGGDNAP
jgi:hypothetical protein